MDEMIADLHHRLPDDEGMTVIELVIAASILLIAIIGLFGTLMTATSMSVQAKQQNIAVNTANSYIEKLRAMPFANVGLPDATSPDASGTLEPTSTIVVSGFTVVINPHVVWVVPDLTVPGFRYKELTVVVSVGGVSSRTYSQRFVTYLRQPDALQSGGGAGGAPPSITFTSGSKFLGAPPIYVSGGSESVSAFAQIATGSSATLKNVEFRCDGTLLSGFGGQDGANAAWVNSGGTSQTLLFAWNTLAVDASGAPVFPDGQRILRILVWDTAGGYRYRDTPVIIDNSPPTRITSAPVLVRRDSATASTISWGPSSDGPTEYANHYVAHVFRETSWYVDRMGVYPPDLGDTELNPGTLGSNPKTNSMSVPTEPLRRYWVKIEAHSYPWFSPHHSLGLTEGQGGTNMVTPFITRPSLTVAGTPSITESSKVFTMTTSLAWQAPEFYHDTLSYTLERSTSATFATVDWSKPYPGAGVLADSNPYVVTVGGSAKVPNPYYYRLKCTVRPTGQYSDGSTYTVYSNSVAMIPTVTGSGSSQVFSLPYTYDWSRDTTP